MNFNSIKANKELKEYMFKHNVSQYDLSKKMGVSDVTIFRRLRKELDPKTKNQYMKTIKEIIKERGE